VLIVARVYKIYKCPLKKNSPFNVKSTWGSLPTTLFPKTKEKKEEVMFMLVLKNSKHGNFDICPQNLRIQ
jgi:hypothetical protein